jgi:hypothetical protein
MEHIKTEHIDQWTPRWSKTATAGPTTDAICQTELLQVAALEYTFFN